MHSNSNWFVCSCEWRGLVYFRLANSFIRSCVEWSATRYCADRFCPCRGIVVYCHKLKGWQIWGEKKLTLLCTPNASFVSVVCLCSCEKICFPYTFRKLYCLFIVFHCRPIWPWTWAKLLRSGIRATAWTLLSINFSDPSRVTIWFPGARRSRRSRSSSAKWGVHTFVYIFFWDISSPHTLAA